MAKNFPKTPVKGTETWASKWLWCFLNPLEKSFKVPEEEEKPRLEPGIPWVPLCPHGSAQGDLAAQPCADGERINAAVAVHWPVCCSLRIPQGGPVRGSHWDGPWLFHTHPSDNIPRASVSSHRSSSPFCPFPWGFCLSVVLFYYLFLWFLFCFHSSYVQGLAYGIPTPDSSFSTKSLAWTLRNQSLFSSSIFLKWFPSCGPQAPSVVIHNGFANWAKEHCFITPLSGG